MNWGEIFFGRDLSIRDVFFIQVTIDEISAIIFDSFRSLGLIGKFRK